VTGPAIATLAYPAELERDLTLGDGAHIRIRPIRAGDAEALMAFHGRLSARTAHQRFFTMLRRLPPDWARHLATVDYHRRLALVAEDVSGGSPVLVAVARYEPTRRTDTVEVAVVVQDGWQNRGLGTHLFRALLAAAAARGVHSFEALVLSDNGPMLDLIARCGEIERRTFASGVTEVTFRRGPT
jgi:RimJ/RimL family protein N-acetyltransferase